MQMANQEFESDFFYMEVIGAVSCCICWGTKVHCYLMGLSELLLHMQ